MDNTFTSILGEGLPKELVEKLQEAFDKKVAEAKEKAEVAIREELSNRYEHDKENLVSAMESVLSKTCEKHEKEKVEETKKLKDAASRFEKAADENTKSTKSKLAKQAKLTESIIAKTLSTEIRKLRESAAKLEDEKSKLNLAYESIKKEVVKDHSSRIKKIDEFVSKQLTKELAELKEDHDALVQTRVKLVTESKRKLKDVQDRFIRESAKKVEQTITESLKSELTQLHEDLERNRQNSFGRRIFETFAAEYLTSYLAEGTEIRKRDQVIESMQSELSTAKQKINEAITNAETVSRKAKIAEAAASRSKILSELLSNLRGEKRAAMEDLLETTKTERLRDTFNKLLPTVVNEGQKPTFRPTPSVQPRVVTGNKTTLVESNKAKEEMDENIAQMMHLAGLRSK